MPIFSRDIYQLNSANKKLEDVACIKITTLSSSSNILRLSSSREHIYQNIQDKEDAYDNTKNNLEPFSNKQKSLCKSLKKFFSKLCENTGSDEIYTPIKPLFDKTTLDSNKLVEEHVYSNTGEITETNSTITYESSSPTTPKNPYLYEALKTEQEKALKPAQKAQEKALKPEQEKALKPEQEKALKLAQEVQEDNSLKEENIYETIPDYYSKNL